MDGRAVKKKVEIAILGLMLLVIILMIVLMTDQAFALTYQDNIGVNFTFNSSIELNLSPSNLVINNLTPSTAADSNIITVNILTNSVNGYTLNATVGNSTTYNTRNLIHNDVNQTAKFSSIDYSTTPTVTTSAGLSPNTWAYSYSTNNGTTWANYNGLPLWDDTTNIATLKTSSGPVASSAGDAIKFKIAAKADANQIAGTYNNVVNFTLVATPMPTTLAMAYANANKTMLNGYYKMQDMNTNICNAVEATDEQLQVIDERDHKVYWIAKLVDGKCWMTQNLDHDIDSTFDYNSTNTDVPVGWSDSLNDTYIIGSNTWYASSVESYNPGDVCFFGEGAICLNWHFHVGNYYNWFAAIASEDYGFMGGGDANQSICPAGWTLPKSGTSTGSFYGLINNNYTVDTINLPPVYFMPSGFWSGALNESRQTGGYWSSTWSYSDEAPGALMFNTSVMTPQSAAPYILGLSVRCVSR